MRGVVLAGLINVLGLACAAPRATLQVPESGFWKVCYTAFGETLNFDGACMFPKEVTWSRLPI